MRRRSTRTKSTADPEVAWVPLVPRDVPVRREIVVSEATRVKRVRQA
jgi:hypothetical protein